MMQSLDALQIASLAQHKITEVVIEKAFELIETLKDRRQHDHPSVTVYSGISEDHGPLYIAVGPTGNALVLPVANLSVAK